MNYCNFNGYLKFCVIKDNNYKEFIFCYVKFYIR